MAVLNDLMTFVKRKYINILIFREGAKKAGKYDAVILVPGV